MKRGILLIIVLIFLVMSFSSLGYLQTTYICNEEKAAEILIEHGVESEVTDCEELVAGTAYEGMCGVSGMCELVEACESDAHCTTWCEDLPIPDGKSIPVCYCDLDSNTCSEVEEQEDIIEDPLAGPLEPAVEDIDISAVEARLASQLELGLSQQAAILADLEVRLTELENKVDAQSTQLQTISQLSTQISSLRGKIDQAASKKDVNGALAGMATLEQDLSQTQEEVAQVEERLSKEESFRQFLIYVFFFLLIVAAGAGAYYYINRNKAPKVSVEVVNYITSHIKQGKKFTQIKANLLRAGWQEEQIQQAYKATMKSNYNSYLEQKGEKPESTQGLDKNKVIIFGILGVIIIVAIVFVLNGVGTGQAIAFAQFNETVDGEVERRFAVLCFAPHIPNSNGGCCLDNNENRVCDFRDELDEVRPQESAGECESNAQCTRSEMCVSSECIDISKLYQIDNCAQTCEIDYVTITTSDDEQYRLQERQGGYTAAGGIEWRVSSGIEFCANEPNLKVPIEIVKKNAGAIIEEEAVLLGQGERSDVIRHPNSRSTRFQLRVDRIEKVCN